MNSTNPQPSWRQAIAHVFSIGAPLVLLLVSIKIHKVWLEPRHVGALGAVAAVTSDLVFVATYVMAGALLYRRFARRKTISIALYVFTFIGAVFAFAEHAFMVKTGAALDWYMISYALSQLHDLDKVLWSEIGVGIFVGLGAVIVISVGMPWAIRRSAWMKRFAQNETPLPWRVIGVVAVLALGLALWGPNLTHSLQRSPLASFLKDAIVQVVTPDEVSAGAAYMVDPLQVEASSDVKPYNVMVFILESIRAQSTTPYVPELTTTPFLDELAKTRGRLVEHAYTVVPHTSKALVAILCGIYPQMTVSVSEASSGGIPTRCLAQVLRDEGYATAFFQPAEERYEARQDLVNNMGFETFIGKETLARPGFDESNYFGYEDDIMVEPSLDWMAKQDKPFFITYLTLTSHHTYNIPQGFPAEQYTRSSRLNKYMNTIRYTDRFLSKVFKGLEERGLLDNTIFLIMGDHGEGFGEHGRYEHDTVIYEEGVRVPMLLGGPGTGQAAQGIDGLRQITDVVPTVLDVLGYDVRGGGLPGRSLLSDGHPQLFTSCWYHQYCMAQLTHDKKIIYHYDRQPTEVFDLKTDPKEKKDIADRFTVAELKNAERQMIDWRNGANVRFLKQGIRRESLLISKEMPQVETPTDITFGDFARLRGYTLASKRVANGRSIEITFVFEALKETDVDWQLFVHVENMSGRLIRNADHIPAEGSHPVRSWKQGEFITDPQRIFIKHGTRVGTHRIVLGFYPKGSSERAPVQGAEAPENKAHLVEFEIVPGRRD